MCHEVAERQPMVGASIFFESAGSDQDKRPLWLEFHGVAAAVVGVLRELPVTLWLA